VPRLDREKCNALQTEFVDYMDSEKSVQITPDGGKLIRQFVEALCDDEAVREKFEDLLRSTKEESGDDSRNPSRDTKRNGGSEFSGEERRKASGGFHLYERRKKPYTYGAARDKNDKRVQFGRGK
jgi:hypothetical protein